MPNPRFIDERERATPELLERIRTAKDVFEDSLDQFCEKWFVNRKDMGNVQGCYLIGSHALPEGWNDETSDVDLKLVIPGIDAELLRRYMVEVLRPKLMAGSRKKDWIDIYIVRDLYSVTQPRIDLTEDWNRY